MIFDRIVESIVPSDLLRLLDWPGCNRWWPAPSAIVVVVGDGMRVVVVDDGLSLVTGNGRRASVETGLVGIIFDGVVEIQLPSLLLLRLHCCRLPAPVVVVVVAPGDVGIDLVVVVGCPGVADGLVLRTGMDGIALHRSVAVDGHAVAVIIVVLRQGAVIHQHHSRHHTGEEL